MAKPYSTTGTCAKLLDVHKELVLICGAIGPEILGSGKVERARAEIGSVCGYLLEIIRLLTEPISTSQSLSEIFSARIPDRLLGCSSLVGIARSEIRVRIRGSEVLRDVVSELDAIEKTLLRIAQRLAASLGKPLSIDALGAAASTVRLTAALEGWEEATGKAKS